MCNDVLDAESSGREGDGVNGDVTGGSRRIEHNPEMRNRSVSSSMK